MHSGSSGQHQRAVRLDDHRRHRAVIVVRRPLTVYPCQTPRTVQRVRREVRYAIQRHQKRVGIRAESLQLPTAFQLLVHPFELPSELLGQKRVQKVTNLVITGESAPPGTRYEHWNSPSVCACRVDRQERRVLAGRTPQTHSTPHPRCCTVCCGSVSVGPVKLATAHEIRSPLPLNCNGFATGRPPSQVALTLT